MNTQAPPPRLAKLAAEIDWQPGSVSFTDWHRVPWDSASVGGVTGKVAVVASEDAVGFPIEGGGHANWLVLVKGEHMIYAVPGCRVAGVGYGIYASSREFAKVP